MNIKVSSNEYSFYEKDIKGDAERHQGRCRETSRERQKDIKEDAEGRAGRDIKDIKGDPERHLGRRRKTSREMQGKRGKKKGWKCCNGGRVLKSLDAPITSTAAALPLKTELNRRIDFEASVHRMPRSCLYF